MCVINYNELNLIFKFWHCLIRQHLFCIFYLLMVHVLKCCRARFVFCFCCSFIMILLTVGVTGISFSAVHIMDREWKLNPKTYFNLADIKKIMMISCYLGKLGY